MRIRRLVPLILVVCCCGNPVIAQRDIEEARLVEKIELLGGIVERDEELPSRPVIKVIFDGGKRFNEKYIHLLKGFKSLASIDLGDMPITAGLVEQIEQPQIVANLLMNATIIQFDAVFPKVRQLGEAVLQHFFAEIDKQPAANERRASSTEREKRALRKANAAVALVRLDHPEQAWFLLRHSPDPRARSYLIHRFAILGVAATELVQQFYRESDLTIRRALLLSLGEYQASQVPDVIRDGLLTNLKECYNTESDPGLHAAAEWLLKNWGEAEWLKQTHEVSYQSATWKSSWAKVEDSIARHQEPNKPQWYLNSQGQQLVVIPGPVTFMMGSPESEPDRHLDEKQHPRQIRRTYALTAKAVTLEQFQRFERNRLLDSAPRKDVPIVEINWDQGARYCNWLSNLEGLQACYKIDEDGISTNDNYLSLNGYRFPTEAEVEFATRAGTTTSRYYGDAEELLSKYAWYRSGSHKQSQPVGLLKPNDFGLFDMHGNVFIWCQDPYEKYRADGQLIIDKENIFLLPATKGRVLRGGAFSDQASYVRSAYRYSLTPSIRAKYIGIRLARTITPDNESSEKPTSGVERD